MTPAQNFELTIAATTGGVASDPLVYGHDSQGHVLTFEVSNAGAGTLSAFKVQLQDHDNGEWYDYLGGADWASSSNSNMLFATTATPATLTLGSKAHCHIRFNGAKRLRFHATTASGTATVTVRGGGRAD